MGHASRTYPLYFRQKDTTQDAVFRELARLSGPARTQTLMRWLMKGRACEQRAKQRKTHVSPSRAHSTVIPTRSLPPAPVDDVVQLISGFGGRRAVTRPPTDGSS